MAYPAKPISLSARALATRKSRSSPPCTMPNSASRGRPFERALAALQPRRNDSRMARSISARFLRQADAIRRRYHPMSEPSSVWISIARSGVSSTIAPSR